jgi:hypothetical protein
MIAGVHVHFLWWLALGGLLSALALLPLRRRLWLERVIFAALLEQGRREVFHEGPEYRPDQRVRAIQQRVSRSIGKRAFSPEVRAMIEKAVDS